MNTEKTLSKTLEALTAVKAGDALRARDLLETIAEQLRDDIRTAEAKKNGKTNALSAAKRILKTAQKTPRPALHKAFYNNGLQCVCDGFRGAELKNPLPLEELPADMETINFARFLDDAKKNNDIILELPELKALKTYIKLCKAESKRDFYFYDFGPGLPFVNAEFLADQLEILPGCKAYAKNNGFNIYFESDDGRGMLCNVRPLEGKQREKTIL
jgi:hypothetical protein